MRKRYFTRHLDRIVWSEIERAKMQDFAQDRAMSVQQPATHAADDRRNQNTTPSRLVIRRVDTAPRPISSTDFGGGILLRRASSHGGQTPRADGGYNRHDTLHESPRASAVSVHYTQAEPRPHLRPTRHGTVQTINPQHQDDNFGGFPNPLTWSINLLHLLFPSLERKIRRTLTVPLTPVLLAPDQGKIPQGARAVPYLRVPMRVGHNSRFIRLSDDDYEELGGVEYRALTALLWIVSGVSTFPLHSPYQRMGRLRIRF